MTEPSVSPITAVLAADGLLDVQPGPAGGNRRRLSVADGRKRRVTTIRQDFEDRLAAVVAASSAPYGQYAEAHRATAGHRGPAGAGGGQMRHILDTPLLRQRTAVSADGTVIGYQTLGAGPNLICGPCGSNGAMHRTHLFVLTNWFRTGDPPALQCCSPMRRLSRERRSIRAGPFLCERLSLITHRNTLIAHMILTEACQQAILLFALYIVLIAFTMPCGGERFARNKLFFLRNDDTLRTGMRVMEWSTRDLAVRDRFPSWYDTMTQTLVCTWLTTDDPARFQASARLADLGGLQFSVMSHQMLQASRPAKLIRQSDPEVFQLHLILTGGGGIRQAGRDATFRAGQLLIIDSSWPYQGWRGADDGSAHSVIVQFPRSALGLRSDMVRQLAAAPIPVQHGITGVLAGHLRHLAENAEGLTPRTAQAVAAVTLDLIAAACADRLETTALLPPESRHQALLSLIHDFIRQRLGDPDLTPETIAAAHQVSVRHLYKIFQKQGVTVAAWIRRCRLEQCHRDLADPRQRSRPIQTIAARWGFTDATTFSRAFRAAYGMSPRDHRNSAAAVIAPLRS